MHDKMLVTYVINLKRSTERMENMDRALKAMQVDYERVEGVDAQLLSEVLLSRNATPSVEYPYEPVSYTHLDVYKRQGEDRTAYPTQGRARFFSSRSKVPTITALPFRLGKRAGNDA